MAARGTANTVSARSPGAFIRLHTLEVVGTWKSAACLRRKASERTPADAPVGRMRLDAAATAPLLPRCAGGAPSVPASCHATRTAAVSRIHPDARWDFEDWRVPTRPPCIPG